MCFLPKQWWMYGLYAVIQTPGFEQACLHSSEGCTFPLRSLSPIVYCRKTDRPQITVASIDHSFPGFSLVNKGIGQSIKKKTQPYTTNPDGPENTINNCILLRKNTLYKLDKLGLLPFHWLRVICKCFYLPIFVSFSSQFWNWEWDSILTIWLQNLALFFSWPGWHKFEETCICFLGFVRWSCGNVLFLLAFLLHVVCFNCWAMLCLQPKPWMSPGWECGVVILWRAAGVTFVSLHSVHCRRAQTVAMPLFLLGVC